MSDALDLLYPDLEEQQRKLARKQAYANALLQQGQGGYAGPGSGLRQAGSSILGAVLSNRSDKQAGELAKSRQSALAQLLGGGVAGPQQPSAPSYVPGQPDLPTDAPQVSNTAPAGGGGGGQPSKLAMMLAILKGDPEGILKAQSYRTPEEQSALQTQQGINIAQGSREPIPQAAERAGALAQAGREPIADAAQRAGGIAQAQEDVQLPGRLAVQQGQQAFTAQQNDLNRQSAQAVAEKRAGSTGKNVQSAIYNDNGTVTVLYRNGEHEILSQDGQPVKAARYDPTAIFNQRAAGQAGIGAGTAAEAFPVVQANYDIIKKSLDAFNDPAIKKEAPYAIGYGSVAPTLPGYNSNFRSMRDQLKGQAFLQAFNALKGGGQITEVEGQKATDAIARLNAVNTPEEFYKALDDARGTFATLFDAAKQRAQRGTTVPQLQGAGTPQSQAQPTGTPSQADIDSELRRRGAIK